MNYAGTSELKDLGGLTISDPEFGSMTLNLYPANKALPEPFARWQKQVNRMLDRVPEVSRFHQHFVTIDSKYFPTEASLRREGKHIDGNFCVDPDFKYATWGGTEPRPKPSWGGVTFGAETPWVSEHGISPPVGTYVSEELGGILCASSRPGCRVWPGTHPYEVMDEGDCSHFPGLSDDVAVDLPANRLHFMTSNTPHESYAIPKGDRRTLIRVTLDHRYPNQEIRKTHED